MDTQPPLAAKDGAGDSGHSARNCHLLEDYLSKGQLGKELDVTERTLYRWHTARIGPPRITIGRQVRYRRAAVEKWLIQREHGPEDSVRARERRPPPFRKQRDAVSKAG